MTSWSTPLLGDKMLWVVMGTCGVLQDAPFLLRPSAVGNHIRIHKVFYKLKGSGDNFGEVVSKSALSSFKIKLP
jgi:hypothetical protein